MSDAAASQAGAEEAQRAVTRSAGVVALGTFLSRALGAVRDAVVAAYFPISLTDAFYVAQTIPNSLRQILGEGAVSAAFIPVFAELDERRGRAAAALYYARFSATFFLLLLCVSLLGVLTAPAWATLYAGGYRALPGKFETTVELTRIMFPYILFAGLAALQAGVLNAVGRFFNASLSPALLNVAMISAPWLFVPAAQLLGLQPIASLALATLAGGVLQVIAQTASVRRAGIGLRPRFALSDPDVRRSLARLLPLLFGTGVYQVNILLSRLLASWLPNGAQSALYYGQRLIEIPQGMLALAVASAALPGLARLTQRGDLEQAKAALRHSLQLSLFVAVPASVALAALAVPTVTVVLGRGAFGPDQIHATARSLVWMAAGVWAVACAQGATRMFYALGDTRTPVLCSALNLVCFLLLSITLMDSLGHSAIALANSGAAIAQLSCLLWLLRRKVGPLGLLQLAKSLLRCCAASAVMAFVASDVAALGDWRRGGNAPDNWLVFAAACALGVAVYAAASYLLRSRELEQIGSLLRSKARKS
jgi:putative peptidoglycan lipid II flippase